MRRRARTLAPALAAVALVTLVAAPALTQVPRFENMAGRSTVYAPRGVIAASQPLAASAGAAVLRDGGNAVDAAITAAAVLNVVEPHMTGVGGDAFALLWSAEEGTLVGLNSSGRAGSGMTLEAIRERFPERFPDDVPVRGAHAITVPGALAGWAALLERYGTISLAEALEPAIRIAREGFPVSPIIAGQWAAEEEVLRADDGARETYLTDDGDAPEPGERFRNPDLARTFERIAREGPGVLYGGELGRRIVGHVRERGGFLALDDLRAHEADWVEPISTGFRGRTVWELPPNGQGIAALEMLRIVDGYPLQEWGRNSPEYLHHLIEAKKLAFADLERYVADPQAMEIDPERLLDDGWVRERRGLIDPGRAKRRVEPGEGVTESETIYLAAADSRGNMISFINSIYYHFGSGIVVPGTGFALQNRGAGFTMEEGHPNAPAPGKRPFHTLIPGFVTRPGPDGEEPLLAFGVMGGSMQPQGHAQLLLNLLLFGMDPQTAIDAPRFRHLDGLRVGLEAPLAEETGPALEAMGHEVVSSDDPSWLWSFGGAQAVLRIPAGWAAGSDPRKDGAAVGH